jgi:hypothetical protein
MRQQSCREFFAKINTDAALQQDFLKAIEGKEDESMLMDAAHSIAEVGTKYGYDFTPQEAAETYKVAGMDVEGGELSEEALELVTGGNWGVHNRAVEATKGMSNEKGQKERMRILEEYYRYGRKV